MTQKAPGKSEHKGMTLLDMVQIFPDEESSRQWLESTIWPHGPVCPHCASDRSSECKNHRPMPYRCKDCRKHYSVKVGTVMQGSSISLQKWAMAIYLHQTSLKGVSSMKLHRDIGVTQKTAWFMLQRIRKAFDSNAEPPFSGPTEVDETYVGGREANKHEADKLKAGRGGVGKMAVVGAKDRKTNKVRAKVVTSTGKAELQGFIGDTTKPDSTVYTDEGRAYKGMQRNHDKVNHSSGEYVREQVHINGIESFWSMLKRAHKGVYHKFSKKHLDRYVQDFAAA